jgi:hypothetical protein
MNMSSNEHTILHQDDVEAVIDERVLDVHTPATATSVNLADVANAINTTGKAAGKMVFDTTTSLPVFASGPAAADSWISVPGNASSTTTNLADVTHQINTVDKFAGKMVYNTTTGLPVFAAGSAAADLWKTAAGETAHSPV